MKFGRGIKRSLIKQIASASVCAVTTVAMVAAFLSPLLTPTSLADNTSPQNTDLFTGQFIPAYLGAAYDPTEAYKEMAGMTVYVFAYDTWGSIVNNFAYKTQIKADGSFQAAALPNASHYGVCVPAYYDSPANGPFRAPEPSDGLSSTFAFAQQTFTNPDGSLHNVPSDQYGNAASFASGSLGGPSGGGTNTGNPCRVFLTSSKTVDIANHVNVFPLVPLSILSVMINDYGGTLKDPAMIGQPYEVFAQRIIYPIDGDTYSSNSVVNGPVIRGRTISTGPGSATTIFQSFAPQGIYAITYWRPAVRDQQQSYTYLTYDGTSPLNTDYNGLAFAQTDNDSTMAAPCTLPNGNPSSSPWSCLAGRNPSPDSNSNVWRAKPGSVNIWGLLKIAAPDGTDMAVSGPTVSLDAQVEGKQGLSFIGFDPVNGHAGQCGPANGQGTVSNFGIYIFSTACPDFTNKDYSVDANLKVSGSVGTAAGSAAVAALGGPNGIHVTVSGSSGPARYDIGLTTGSATGVTGMLKANGQVLANVSLNLQVNGATYSSVAQTDSDGRFVIPGTYFTTDPYAKYQLTVNTPPGFNNANYNTAFNIDTSSLSSPTLAMNYLGDVSLDRIQSPVEQWLANLPIPNLYAIFHTPTALAADTTVGASGTLNQGAIDGVKVNEAPNGNIFYFNLGALGDWANRINKGTYKLTKVELDAPPEAVGNNEDYVDFYRQEASDGYVLANPSDLNSQIIGVNVRYKPATVDYKQVFWRLGVTNGSLQFKLKVALEYVGQVNTDTNTLTASDNGSASQDPSSNLPKNFTAEQDVTITESGSDPLSGATYTFSSPGIVLTPQPPDCTGGSMLQLNVKNIITNVACNAISGILGMVNNAMNIIVNRFFYMDPLGLLGSGITNAWNIIRNFVNGFSVLILLIAGVAIMLRYEPKTFSIQSVLTKLIIMIVLVNFSILILQAAIDVANVIAAGGYHFLVSTLGGISTGSPSVNTGSTAGGALAALTGLGVIIFGVVLASGGSLLIAGLLGLLCIFTLLGFVAVKIFFDWAARMVTLVLCIVLAPIAFAAYVLPATKKAFTRWRDLLIGALVGQMAFALVLGIAVGLMMQAVTQVGANAIITFVLAIILFYASTKVSTKAAAAVGSVGLGPSMLSMAKQIQGSGKKAVMNYATQRALTTAREQELGVDKESREQELVRRYGNRNFFAKTAGRAKIRLDSQRKMTADSIEHSGVVTKGWEPIKKGHVIDALIRNPGGAIVNRAVDLTPEDVESAGERARKQYVRQQEAKLYAQNPHLERVQMKSALEDSENKLNTEAFNTLFSLNTSSFSGIDQFVNSDRNFWLDRNGDGSGDSMFTEERLKRALMGDGDKYKGVLRNAKTQRAKDELTRYLAQIGEDGFRTKADYNRWRSGFTYKDENGVTKTGNEAWQAWWKDAGIPGGEAFSVTQARRATDNLILQRAATALGTDKNTNYSSVGFASSVSRSIKQMDQGQVEKPDRLVPGSGPATASTRIPAPPAAADAAVMPILAAAGFAPLRNAPATLGGGVSATDAENYRIDLENIQNRLAAGAITWDPTIEAQYRHLYDELLRAGYTP